MKRQTNIRHLANNVIIITLLLFCNCSLYSQSSIFQPSTFTQIATGFGFTEGPVWSSTDSSLYFSDITGNTIYKWNEIDGAVPFITPSGNSNGIVIKNGNLIIAQHGSRQIARVENKGIITPLVGYYNGLRLNSPNDLAVRSDGKIYFTDPPYGITPPLEELGFNGVFYYDEASDTLVLITDSIDKPNGLAFSPDESILYINDSYGKKVFAYTMRPDGTCQSVRVFASLTDEVDGIKTDAVGNVYVAAAFNGIKVFNSSGSRIDSIAVPEKTTNLNWGGNDGKTLFITSGTSVYSVRLSIAAAVESSELEVMSAVKVFPNPFTDNITICLENSTDRITSFTISDCRRRIIWEAKDIDYNTAQNSLQVKLSSSINSGMYFLKITTVGKTIEKKLIKL